MVYRVYKLGRDGSLAYTTTSNSMGDGPREVGLIAEGHRLKPGDVVELGESFIMLREVTYKRVGDAPDVRYHYLPRGDDDTVYKDGRWSLAMIRRLVHEAELCESMSE